MYHHQKAKKRLRKSHWGFWSSLRASVIRFSLESSVTEFSLWFSMIRSSLRSSVIVFSLGFLVTGFSLESYRILSDRILLRDRNDSIILRVLSGRVLSIVLNNKVFFCVLCRQWSLSWALSGSSLEPSFFFFRYANIFWSQKCATTF